MTIQISSVSMSYQIRGSSIQALDSVSINVRKAEFLALVGPSGCGKSTLLKLTAGLLTPTAGDIAVDGHRVAGPRTDMGFMFQTPVLLPWMSVFNNVMLQAAVRGLDRRTYDKRGRTLLSQVGLSGYEDRYVFELSGGMQQRVAFCRAIMHEPSVLLMDEPFGALDALTREQVALDLQRMWLTQGGQTVLFVTHSIAEAALLADRVAVFSPQPGAILRLFDVPFARPRTTDTMNSKEFGALTTEIRRLIYSAGWGRAQGEATPSATLHGPTHGAM
jgi:NitT/TauT family transport system ATP-binding protein